MDSLKQKKLRIIKIVGIALPALLCIAVAGGLSFSILRGALHLDFSQEYRQVDGVEKIRFQDKRDHKIYARTFWGLRPVGKDESSQSNIQDVKKMDDKYTLFCEKEYGVNGGYSTDEEYCYYKVVDIETGEQYTVYAGYRQWFDVYWE